MRLVGEHGPAVGGRPADQPLTELRAHLQRLLLPRPTHDERDDDLLLDVGFGDQKRRARDELGHRLGRTLQQRGQALLAEEVVIERRQTLVGRNQRATFAMFHGAADLQNLGEQ